MMYKDLPSYIQWCNVFDDALKFMQEDVQPSSTSLRGRCWPPNLCKAL